MHGTPNLRGAINPHDGPARAENLPSASPKAVPRDGRTGLLVPGLLVFGLAAIVGFVAWQGLDEVALIFSRMGWAVLTLPILYAVPLILAAWAWRSLLPARPAPGMGPLIKAIWIGRSINDLTPTGGLSGDIVRARLIMGSGLRGHGVVASLVLDKTVQAAVLVVQGAAAIAVLPLLGAPREIVLASLAGWTLLTLGIVGFVLVQRGGLFAGFAKGAAFALSGRRFPALVGKARGLDAAVRALYRQPGRFASAFGFTLLFRLAFVIELWLIAILVQHPISVLDAFMIEGLSAVLRGAAFIVPGALGVQEGSYIVLGAIVGLDPAVMLAFSLTKRAREILVGVPGLLAWQGIEGGIVLGRLRGRSKIPTKPSAAGQR